MVLSDAQYDVTAGQSLPHYPSIFSVDSKDLIGGITAALICVYVFMHVCVCMLIWRQESREGGPSFITLLDLSTRDLFGLEGLGERASFKITWDAWL